MKKLLKYSVFILLLYFLIFFEGVVLKTAFASFWILICFCIYKKSGLAMMLCAFFGVFRDVISHTLPYFSLIYLYISVGCVWCADIFLGIDSKKVILVSLLALGSYCVFCFFINAVSYSGIYLLSEMVFSLFGAVFLSMLSPFVCFLFKRFKF